MKGILAAVVMAFALGAAPSRAEPDPRALEAPFKSCEANIAQFRDRLESTTLWGNVLMILGATASALGAACAGFLKADRQRRVAAVCGALGAVITVCPKALPDREAIQTNLVSAEKHRVVGAKVKNQLQFAREDESITDAMKYAMARFEDCSSLTPPSSVPEFPAPPLAIVQRVDSAVTSQPQRFEAAPSQEPPHGFQTVPVAAASASVSPKRPFIPLPKGEPKRPFAPATRPGPKVEKFDRF